MDNKVVQTLARAFVQCGWTAGALQLPRRRHQRRRARRRPRRSTDMQASCRRSRPRARWRWPAFPSARSSPAQALQALWAARDVRQVVLVGTAAARFQVPRCRPKAHERTLVVHGEADDTVRCSRCWTGRGRSHFRLRSFPGASISFTDNCRC
jgi:hypothetical protein